MASGGERERFEEAPASFKSSVWEHFGFAVDYNDEGQKTVDKTKSVCKRCLTRVPYANGNTSNMGMHLRRKHPDVSLSQSRTAAQDLEKRYTKADVQKYLQKATALDPRFKSLPFIDEPSRVQLYRDLTTEILEHEQQSQAESETRPSTSTEERHASSPPPQKKTAMAELFGAVFKTKDQTLKDVPLNGENAQVPQSPLSHGVPGVTFYLLEAGRASLDPSRRYSHGGDQAHESVHLRHGFIQPIRLHEQDDVTQFAVGMDLLVTVKELQLSLQLHQVKEMAIGLGQAFQRLGWELCVERLLKIQQLHEEQPVQMLKALLGLSPETVVVESPVDVSRVLRVPPSLPFVKRPLRSELLQLLLETRPWHEDISVVSRRFEGGVGLRERPLKSEEQKHELEILQLGLQAVRPCATVSSSASGRSVTPLEATVLTALEVKSLRAGAPSGVSVHPASSVQVLSEEEKEEEEKKEANPPSAAKNTLASGTVQAVRVAVHEHRAGGHGADPRLQRVESRPPSHVCATRFSATLNADISLPTTANDDDTRSSPSKHPRNRSRMAPRASTQRTTSDGWRRVRLPPHLVPDGGGHRGDQAVPHGAGRRGQHRARLQALGEQRVVAGERLRQLLLAAAAALLLRVVDVVDVVVVLDGGGQLPHAQEGGGRVVVLRGVQADLVHVHVSSGTRSAGARPSSL
ncbi:hypothetical protein N1851_014613 [Merluccius polli]|uniref:BED-type domain-containing protein n=1 Tax=Merluccius polli TaxID=89951 RepID=A0AA47P387_MERPO|nr:hypothetical protein N1851_014613 [Merluccius polli]